MAKVPAVKVLAEMAEMAEMILLAQEKVLMAMEQVITQAIRTLTHLQQAI